MIDTTMRMLAGAARPPAGPDDALAMTASLETTDAAAGGDADFGAVFREVASQAYDRLKGAEATAVAGITGGASTQAVAEAAMTAELTLSSVVAIRDKLVSAWQDLARMPI